MLPEIEKQSTSVAAGHKCARLHGHSFRVELHVTGTVGKETGWVMDFGDIKSVFQPFYDEPAVLSDGTRIQHTAMAHGRPNNCAHHEMPSRLALKPDSIRENYRRPSN